jgi:hypothetical protein
MEPEELGAILREMYNNAPKGEAVASIHLFGVRHAEELRNCGATPKNIAKLAGMSESYGVEINKGIKLARYVQER